MKWHLNYLHDRIVLSPISTDAAEPEVAVSKMCQVGKLPHGTHDVGGEPSDIAYTEVFTTGLTTSPAFKFSLPSRHDWFAVVLTASRRITIA